MCSAVKKAIRLLALGNSSLMKMLCLIPWKDFARNLMLLHLICAVMSAYIGVKNGFNLKRILRFLSGDTIFTPVLLKKVM